LFGVERQPSSSARTAEDRHRAPREQSSPLTSQRETRYSFGVAKGHTTPHEKTDVLQGTLDLMVLQTLDTMGPLHGYGIARRIEQISEDALKLNEGTVYASLMRLLHRRWISASWGTSENNRKARFYAITPGGRRQLTRETENWQRIAGVIARLLRRATQS
jgi:PadR family transcriptional regulator PadR